MDLETVIRWFEEADDATIDARQQSERDRDYYDNKQWTPDEAETLKKRGQPAITINRIKPKVDFLLGTERTSRTDPRAFPRTPMDDEAAKAASDAIQYVCDRECFPEKRSDVAENIWIEGAGAIIVEVDPKMEIVLRRIAWDRFFYDPHSRERNFSDAKYLGIVAWMDADEAEAIYPGAGELIENAITTYETSQTYDDKPTRWIDTKRKRVKLCEVYYRKSGVWYHCVYTKFGFVKEPKPSDYLDEDGEPDNPIVAMSCYVDRENQRYGVVRQYIGPQDEINKRRSKALHIMSVRQVRADRGAVDDIQRARKELSKPDGWIDTNPGYTMEILPTGDMAAAQFQLLQEAKQEIDAVGANAALTGKQDGSESGRALQARQQGGLVELGPVLDAVRQWQRAVYKQIWARIKQYWTAEKWIRVTDNDKNVRFVGLNQPLTAGEQLVQQAQQQGMPPAQLENLAMQVQADPRMRQVVGLKNDVSRMDMDIILEDVPDTVSIQQEEFELLTQAYQTNPQTPVNPAGIPFELVIEASNLRNKQKILEHIRGQGQMPPDMPMPGAIPATSGVAQEGMPIEGMPPEPMIEPPVDPAAMAVQAVQEATQQAVATIQQAAEQQAQQAQQFTTQLQALMQQISVLDQAQALNAATQGIASLLQQQPTQTTVTLPSGRQASVVTQPV